MGMPTQRTESGNGASPALGCWQTPQGRCRFGPTGVRRPRRACLDAQKLDCWLSTVEYHLRAVGLPALRRAYMMGDTPSADAFAALLHGVERLVTTTARLQDNGTDGDDVNPASSGGRRCLVVDEPGQRCGHRKGRGQNTKPCPPEWWAAHVHCVAEGLAEWATAARVAVRGAAGGQDVLGPLLRRLRALQTRLNILQERQPAVDARPETVSDPAPSTDAFRAWRLEILALLEDSGLPYADNPERGAECLDLFLQTCLEQHVAPARPPGNSFQGCVRSRKEASRCIFTRRGRPPRPAEACQLSDPVGRASCGTATVQALVKELCRVPDDTARAAAGRAHFLAGLLHLRGLLAQAPGGDGDA